jgi:hypothetical protein
MKIPSNVVDNRPAPFPIGTYQGELGDTEERWTPDQESQFLRLSFVNNGAADDNTDDCGNRIMRDDLCLRYRGDSLYDYDEVTGEMPFLLRRAAGLLGGLAVAFGATGRDAAGGVDLDLASFVADIQEGAYAGESVRFNVEHNEWTPKDAEEGTPPRVDAQVRRFAPAL